MHKYCGIKRIILHILAYLFIHGYAADMYVQRSYKYSLYSRGKFVGLLNW